MTTMSLTTYISPRLFGLQLTRDQMNSLTTLVFMRALYIVICAQRTLFMTQKKHKLSPTYRLSTFLYDILVILYGELFLFKLRGNVPSFEDQVITEEMRYFISTSRVLFSPCMVLIFTFIKSDDDIEQRQIRRLVEREDEDQFAH